MPWDVVIQNESVENGLGSLEAVNAWLKVTLAGVTLKRLPPYPPDVLEKMSQALERAPAHIRETITTKPHYGAQFRDDVDGISLVFSYQGDQPLSHLFVSVRGGGNPLRVLARICLPQKWTAWDAGADKAIDLTKDTSPGWERFTGVVKSIMTKGE